MLQTELIAKIETPTTQKNENGESRNAIGTGYPIQEGLVLTARHVLYHEDRDTNKERKIIWQKEDEDAAYFESQFPEKNILFESAEFDVALIRCETPEANFQKPIVLPTFQETGEIWESMGYPTAGKDFTSGKRAKIPAKGDIFKYDPDNHIQFLSTEADAHKLELWKGLSGAPVFNKYTDQLIAVITRAPDKYRDKNGKLEDRFKNIILATSIPYLLTEGKCPEFRKLVLNQKEIETLLPEEKLDKEFSDYVASKIVDEFDSLENDGVLLCQRLAKDLRLGSSSDKNKSDSQIYEAVAYALVTVKFEKSIKILGKATAECVTEDGFLFRDIKSTKRTKESSQRIFGWLLLRAIDEKQLSSFIPKCLKYDSLFFTLASVQSLAGIEVVMARRFNRKTVLIPGNRAKHQSSHITTLPEHCFHSDPHENVRKIFIEIWNQIFKDEHINDTEYQPDTDDWEQLNEELEYRRSDVDAEEHYYIPFKPSDHEIAPDFIRGVYQELLKKLNQMTVIQYGEEGSDCHLFIVKERRLRTIINGFYRAINGEKG